MSACPDVSLAVASPGGADSAAMSRYERERWEELQTHWEAKAVGRQLLPPRAQAALSKSGQATRATASKAGHAIAGATPEKVKDVAGSAAGAALAPTVRHVVQLIELFTDWVVELNDPEAVLRHHRSRGRNVETLQDLRALDLEVLDEFTQGMVLRWRTLGAGQGASFGALAMIPVPGVGSAAAISLDFIAMQALTAAIASRVCYSYGFDATEPEMRHAIDRMVLRTYRDQSAKAGSVKKAGAAFSAAKDRVKWSKKLRDDHHLMAAIEKLLQVVGNGSRVPVSHARMGLPVVAVFAGAATNSHVLGDTVKQARHYGATMLLADKYGVELPPTLRHDLNPVGV